MVIKGVVVYRFKSGNKRFISIVEVLSIVIKCVVF